MNYISFSLKLVILSVAESSYTYEQNETHYIFTEFFKTEYFPITYSVVVLPIYNKGNSFHLNVHTIFAQTNRKILLVDQINPDVVNREKMFLILNEDDNITDLLVHLQNLRRAQVYNPKIVIWFKTLEKKDIIDRLFQECAKHLFIQVIIAHPEGQENCELESNNKTNCTYLLELTIANIFHFIDHKKDATTIQRFYVDKYNIQYVLYEISDLFKDYCTDLKGTILTVMAVPQRISVSIIQKPNHTVDYIGVDMSALNEMARLLNFTPKIKIGEPEQYGNTFRNGSYTKSVTDLLTNKIFLNINRYLIPYRPDITLVFTIDSEKFCFVLNDPLDFDKRWALLSGFQPTVWFAICTAVIIVCTFWKIFQIHKGVPRYPILILVQALFSSRALKPYFAYQRLVWILWLFFVYVLHSSIIGTIVTQMTKPIKQHQIKTLKELLHSNTTIMTSIGHFDISHNNSVIISLMDRAKDLFNDSTQTTISELQESAILTSTHTRIHFHNYCKTSSQCYYVLLECVYSSYSGYIMATRNPLLDVIHDIVVSFVEHGFYIKWMADYKFNQTLGLDPWRPIFNNTNKTTLTCLSLKNLHLAFLIYVFGLLLSMIMFVGEVIHYKISNHYSCKENGR